LSDFQRGKIIGAHLAGAFVIISANLLGVSREAVSKAMTSYTNHEKTSLAERNGGRKPKLSGKDCRLLLRIVSKNHRNIAAKVRTELNINLEDPVKKMFDESFKNLISPVELQLLYF